MNETNLQRSAGLMANAFIYLITFIALTIAEHIFNSNLSTAITMCLFMMSSSIIFCMLFATNVDRKMPFIVILICFTIMLPAAFFVIMVDWVIKNLRIAKNNLLMDGGDNNE